MQTMVYDSRTGCFVFYRGGYNQETRKGLDPYHREFEPLTEEKGYRPFNHGVADGLLIHAQSTYSHNVIDFFFGKDFDGSLGSKDYIATGNWSVCFDACGRIVFFDSDSPMPKRVTKEVKTECKFYKEWMTGSFASHMDGWPRKVSGWKFSPGTKYCIADINLDYLFQLLPVEYDRLELGKKSLFRHEEYLETLQRLYELEPVRLSDSWDRTDEEKEEIRKEIEKIRSEKAARAAELEERKRTPGYCSHCGAEGASYVANPYYEEMYGETHMEWLCSDCYHDCAMDV